MQYIKELMASLNHLIGKTLVNLSALHWRSCIQTLTEAYMYMAIYAKVIIARNIQIMKQLNVDVSPPANIMTFRLTLTNVTFGLDLHSFGDMNYCPVILV